MSPLLVRIPPTDASEVAALPELTCSELAIPMKRLGKRDEVTRVKALKQLQNEIQSLFADVLPEDIAKSGGPSGQLYAFIVHYGHIFRRISVEDSSQRVWC